MGVPGSRLCTLLLGHICLGTSLDSQTSLKQQERADGVGIRRGPWGQRLSIELAETIVSAHRLCPWSPWAPGWPFTSFRNSFCPHQVGGERQWPCIPEGVGDESPQNQLKYWPTADQEDLHLPPVESGGLLWLVLLTEEL